MRPFQKVFWLLLIGAFLFSEFRAIDKDRAISDFEQGLIRLQERGQLNNILQQSQLQFKETLDQQKQHFDATMQKEQINADEITGGNSFVVVFPDFTPKIDTFPLIIAVCQTCGYSVFDAYIYFQSDLMSNDNGTLFYHDTINQNVGYNSKFTISPSRTQESQFRITVVARNKPTKEILKVRFNAHSGRWECSWHIERTEKNPHYNPTTKMAEGLVVRDLQDWDWNSNQQTPINQNKIKVIPLRRPS